MATRTGRVHVATTRRAYKGKLYETHLLRRTYREGGKVKHETVGNLSHLPPTIIGIVREALRGDFVPGGGGGLEMLRSWPHGHIAAVLGTLRKLGLEQMIAAEPSIQRTLAVAMVVMRIIRPGSKLATNRRLQPESACSSLGLELALPPVSENDFYQAMDWLLERQSRIEAKLAKKHLHEGTLVLYDVSSSYYTGNHCSLANFGYSRDGKKGFPQIVYGLLCNADGCPVATEVFEGSTGDPKTLSKQIEKIRNRFGLQRVILVGDRGMITSKRIDEALRDVEGLDWITSLRADAIKKLAEQKIVQPELFDQRDLAEVTSPDYPGERLIVCRNPLLAAERARRRQELLEATEANLEKIVAATRRKKNRLKGKDKIGVRVGKIIGRHKMGKHFILEIGEDSFTYRRDEAKIAAEAALDGIYVIRTSVPQECLGTESTVRAYKDLAKVERAFRSMKTVDLKVRPIYHRLEDRVRAHVFLCMLAYYVEWHMREALKPMLFEDEDREAAEAARRSIVAPAQRSISAKRKDAEKRTEDDMPVHSFQTLLDDLATLTKNSVRPKGVKGGDFYMFPSPTEVQRRAFALLQLSLPS